MVAAAAGLRDEALETVVNSLRGNNGTTLFGNYIETAKEEEGAAGAFVGFMVMWLSAATVVVTLNAWQDKPRLGAISALCICCCPGGLFAFCYPMDGPSTSCGEAGDDVPAAESRPLLRNGTTTSISQEEESGATRLWRDVLFTFAYLYVVIYVAYAGVSGASSGCAPVLSNILIFKVALMISIVGLQMYLHSLTQDDFHWTRLGIVMVQSLKLPDGQALQDKLRHIMQFQQALFITSVGVTMGMLTSAPTITIENKDDACANGTLQTFAASLFVWCWAGMMIAAAWLFYSGDKDSRGLKQLFITTGHLYPL